MRTAGSRGRAADVAVAGGGLIGLAAARELARRGARVTLIEAGEPGSEASRAAGGMLAPQSEADRDDEFFRLQCASREMYPAFAEQLREETGRDVELDRTGTLYLALTEEDERELEARHRWQREAGLEVERLTCAEARSLEPALSPRVRLALRFPRDWQVENRELLAALREAAERYGTAVMTETRALGVRARGGRVEGVETSRGFVAAGAVVVAAGAWSSQIELRGEGGAAAPPPAPRVVPVRGQMLCFAPQVEGAPLLRHVVYSRRGYLVPRRDGRLLAGSTTEEAGFRKEVTAEGLHSILSHALEIAPAAAGLALADAWAGLRPRADDALPVIGESPSARGLFYATAHYRNGVLLAPLTADAVSRMVIGGDAAGAPPPYEVQSFSPSRFPPARAISSQA